MDCNLHPDRRWVTEKYLAASGKSMDPDAAALFEENCRELYNQVARIAITTRWVRIYDFGAGRLPRFLRKLVDRDMGRALASCLSAR
jgi:hypothetical protein